MTETEDTEQSSLSRSVIAAMGILRRHILDAGIRKITVNPRGEVWTHSAPLKRVFTGEYMKEDELWRIVWSVKVLPESAVKKICGNWEAKKFEAVFVNGWKIRAKKSRTWGQHMLIFTK